MTACKDPYCTSAVDLTALGSELCVCVSWGDLSDLFTSADPTAGGYLYYIKPQNYDSKVGILATSNMFNLTQNILLGCIHIQCFSMYICPSNLTRIPTHKMSSECSSVPLRLAGQVLPYCSTVLGLFVSTRVCWLVCGDTYLLKLSLRQGSVLLVRLQY